MTPVYDDWDSFNRLLSDIDETLGGHDAEYSVLAVNDDSSDPPPKDLTSATRCDILHLTCNLGHQRAVAIGLAQLAETADFDAVIVMDSDGEDLPRYLPELIETSVQHPDTIVAARRDKRSEGRTFRLGYRIYQLMFRLFTGKTLSFGNFCLIPSNVVKRLVYQESIWNHLAATILRSRFEVKMISTERGRRYAGESKMNLGSLVLLGLSAISVYNDVALLRTLAVSFLLSLVAVAGIFVTTFIRVFTDMAIPGWASNVVGSMTIILIQALVISIFVLFIVLANRSQRGFVAARHYRDYVLDIEEVTPG